MLTLNKPSPYHPIPPYNNKALIMDTLQTCFEKGLGHFKNNTIFSDKNYIFDTILYPTHMTYMTTLGYFCFLTPKEKLLSPKTHGQNKILIIVTVPDV